MQRSTSRGIAVTTFVIAAAVVSFAGPVNLSNSVFTIEATNAQGSASYTATVADGTLFPGVAFLWNGGGIPLVDQNNMQQIAMLGQGGTTIIFDPVIGITFEVIAGLSDTTFTISSALLSFPGIPNAEVSATSSLGVTDVGGTPPGASLIGQYLGPKAYLTQYNGAVPFDTQIDPIIAAPGNSAGAAENPPPQIVPGVISDMSSQLKFTLSAGDRGNGTVNYTIKPEPGTVLMLGAGALLFARRRR